jgi:hypothetical protein
MFPHISPRAAFVAALGYAKRRSLSSPRSVRFFVVHSPTLVTGSNSHCLRVATLSSTIATTTTTTTTAAASASSSVAEASVSPSTRNRSSVLDTTDGHMQVLFERPTHHAGSLYCVRFDTTGQLVASGSNDKSVKVCTVVTADVGGSTTTAKDVVLTGHTGISFGVVMVVVVVVVVVVAFWWWWWRWWWWVVIILWCRLCPDKQYFPKPRSVIFQMAVDWQGCNRWSFLVVAD